MATTLILLTAITVVVLVTMLKFLYERFKVVTIIDKIPGPKGYPILGMALTLSRISREDIHMWFVDQCRKYKEGIFCTWIGLTPNIHLTTAETIGVVMSSKSLITKSSFYDFFHPWLGTGLITSTGDKWHRQRKLITPTFHYNVFEQYADVMSENAEILKDRIALEMKNSPRNPLEVFHLLTKCALDVICESAMGININAQTEHDAEYSVALHSITVQIVERSIRPWLHADWIYYRTSHGKRFKNNVEITQKFTNQVICDRKKSRKNQRENLNLDTGKPKRRAFLDHLLDACERDNMLLTDEEVREEVDTFMFAGHDTTSVAMSWALFCIGNHPEVQEKIHEEQLQVFGDSTEPATLHQLSELKYLERVIKETLRLFPSVPSISRNVTEDLEIAGYKIPKSDAIVILQVHHVHRDPDYWSEPEKFDPDRFLPENSHGRHPYAYVPFSAGLRNCIGQKFSLLEQKTILTALLRTWRVKSLVKFDEAKYYAELILRPQDGIKIYFTRK